MKMRWKALAGAAVAVALVVAPLTMAGASAHTGDLHASADCDTETGQYTITYTLELSNVPAGRVGTTSWRVGGSSFDGTPSSTAGMDRGPIGSTGTQTITLGTSTLPGTTTGNGPWVYAYTTWQDGQGHTIGRGSDSRIEGLDGDCAPPPPAKVKPGPPMVKDLCETANDHYGLPEPTEGIAYSRDGLNLVAELTSDEYELDLSDTGWVADDDGTATYYFDEEDFTDINCEEVVPIPALFAAAPTPPTCDAAGALPNLAAAQHVTVTVSPAFDGPGTYTIVADTDEGYEFPDGTTHKQIVLTVLGATGYQSENSTAPCFRAVLPAPAAPEFTDECGTADDGYSIPEDTEDYYYEVSEDGGSVFVEAFAVAEEDVFPEGTVTQWEFTFTDEPCATPTPTPLPAAPAALPATGGVDMTPWGIGAAVMLLAGAALLASRRLARR